MCVKKNEAKCWCSAVAKISRGSMHQSWWSPHHASLGTCPATCCHKHMLLGRACQGRALPSNQNRPPLQLLLLPLWPSYQPSTRGSACSNKQETHLWPVRQLPLRAARIRPGRGGRRRQGSRRSARSSAPQSSSWCPDHNPGSQQNPPPAAA